jgi:chromosome segregation ATPase
VINIEKLRRMYEDAGTSAVVVEYQMPDGTWTENYDEAKNAWPTLERFPFRTRSARDEYREAASRALPYLLDEVETLRSQLRVTEELFDALGDANVLAVELEHTRLLAATAEKKRDEYKATHEVLYKRVQEDIISHHDLLAQIKDLQAEVTRWKASYEQLEDRYAEVTAARAQGLQALATYSEASKKWLQTQAELEFEVARWKTNWDEAVELARVKSVVHAAAMAWYECAKSDAGLIGACGRHDDRLYAAIKAEVEGENETE